MNTTPEHDCPAQHEAAGHDRDRESGTGKPYPPRWVMIYMLVLVLAAIVWIILSVLHGGPPWYRHW
jgi:hypothetical protein